MHCWEEMFQGDSSSIILSVWMGCGDYYRNEETTCSFKVYQVYLLSEQISARKEKYVERSGFRKRSG